MRVIKGALCKAFAQRGGKVRKQGFWATTLGVVGLCYAQGTLAQTTPISQPNEATPSTKATDDIQVNAEVPDISVSADAALPPQCVLHVWPGRGFKTVYAGWVHGGTVDGSQKGRSGYPSIPAEPLSVTVQHEELSKLDIASLLGLNGYVTVVHDAPLPLAAIRSTKARQIADSGDCYAELMIETITFQNHVVNGKWINVIFRYRQYAGTAAEPASSFGTYILSRTALFPPDADTDPQPALTELREAFAKAVNEFGVQYAGHLERGGKRKRPSITL